MPMGSDGQLVIYLFTARDRSSILIRRFVCMYVCMYVCRPVSVCSLITRERGGQLRPNFQGGSRVSEGWFEVQKVGVEVMCSGPRNWHFSYACIIL